MRSMLPSARKPSSSAGDPVDVFQSTNAIRWSSLSLLNHLGARVYTDDAFEWINSLVACPIQCHRSGAGTAKTQQYQFHSRDPRQWSIGLFMIFQNETKS